MPEKSEREEIMDLIRNEYDPAPSYYKMGDDWDDGAGRIADAILADKILLLRKQPGGPRPQAAIDALTSGQVQCDEDGVMIQVSRPALDEVLTYLATTH